jgi:RHS repeat-associated protein
MTDNGTITSYDANHLNQYTAVDGDTPTYDSNGNLKTQRGWTYVYDAQNRLTLAQSGRNTVSFSYDPRNRCVSRTVNGIVTFFYWSGWTLIEEQNSRSTLMARYVNGANVDEIIARVTPSLTAYYHHDALGSVVALTSAAGKIMERYSYDVFGAPIFKDANGETVSSSASGNRFLFTGREYVQQLAFYDYRNRVYSPGLGRFLQTDPIRFEGRDANLYRYVANNPLSGRDPSGLITCMKPFWDFFSCSTPLGTLYACFVAGTAAGDGDTNAFQQEVGSAYSEMDYACLLSTYGRFQTGCAALKEAHVRHWAWVMN